MSQETTDADPSEASMLAAQYPGFAISCGKCGSARVEVDVSFGYSATSGSWGSVDLHCLACDNRVDIFAGG